MISRIRHELEHEINTLRKSIQRSEESIQRLKAEKLPFSTSRMVENHKKKILDTQKQITELEQKLHEVNSENYEEKLKKEKQHNMNVIKQKTELKKKKIEQKTPKYVHKESNNYGNRYFSEHQINQDLKYFYKDSSTLPDYMYDKLVDMPHNMGYIWRNIWFFGYKSNTKDAHILTMNEKKDNKYYVHVYDKNKMIYTLYQKDTEGKKILVKNMKLKQLG